MWIDDDVLLQCEQPCHISIWQPEKSIVILGSGNKAETECNLTQCENSGIKVLKRYGGGGTVLLHSGCVIISLGCWVSQPYQNDRYFQKINQAIIDCLGSKWPILAKLSQRGLSDIAFDEKKIAGTSLFRSRNYLLYQASLLVADHSDEISKMLAHPSKEPDYRKGKNHHDFLSCLDKIDPSISAKGVQKHLETDLQKFIFTHLNEDFIEVQKDQIKHIKKRATKNN